MRRTLLPVLLSGLVAGASAFQGGMLPGTVLRSLAICRPRTAGAAPRLCGAGKRGMRMSGSAASGKERAVAFRGRRVVVQDGELLRSALLKRELTPHNGRAKLINCRGLGTCGTCAVSIEGQVEPSTWNAQESLRLNFPPHKAPNNQKLRLACQVRVCGDLSVTKYTGFWGQYDEESRDTSFEVPFGELEYILDRSGSKGEDPKDPNRE